MLKIVRKINKYGPEHFTYRLYTKIFTLIRVPTFWILAVITIVDMLWLKIDVVQWLPLWSADIFHALSTKLIYLLLSIGAFSAAFYTIGIEIIKRTTTAGDVTFIFANLVKYATYPFIVAGVIGGCLFLAKVGIVIPQSMVLFVLFVYLTLNAFYTTIKIAEHLVNMAFGIELKQIEE